MAGTAVAPLSAALDAPLAAEQDALWCATFQLCWDELRRWLEGDVRVEPPSALADALNAGRADPQSMPEGATVAAAGPVGEGVLDRLATLARERLGADADLPMLAELRRGSYDPRDVIAYAALLRRLAFPVPFERRDRFQFGDATVAGFGLGGARVAEQRAQVHVHRYESPTDFVCSIDTDRADERVVLARLEPEPTLAATLAKVVDASHGDSEALRPTDLFAVPCVAIDTATEYSDLVGRTVIAAQQRYSIARAMQNLRFELDETGAFVRSEAGVIMRMSAIRAEEPPRRLICDGPFLLLLQRRGSAMPYAAAWVATPALLAR